MITYLIECLLLAFCCGLVAAVYRNVLAYEPVLNWWFRFGNRFENRWFFAPVWGCVKCIAGQLGLWLYIFLELLPLLFAKKGGVLEIKGPICEIFGILIVITGAIFTALLLTRIIKQIEENN